MRESLIRRVHLSILANSQSTEDTPFWLAPSPRPATNASGWETKSPSLRWQNLGIPHLRKAEQWGRPELTSIRNWHMFLRWSPCSWITSPYSGCSITVPLQANFCKQKTCRTWGQATTLDPFQFASSCSQQMVIYSRHPFPFFGSRQGFFV